MRGVVAGAVIVLSVWLTFFPMFDATKRERDAWPWIIGGFLFGPLSGLAYLTSRRAQRLVAARNGESFE